MGAHSAPGDRERSDALDDLAALYARCGAACFGLAMALTHDRGYAEDAVWDAYLSLWRETERSELRDANIRARLLMLVHHRAVDIVRRKGLPRPDVPDCQQILAADPRVAMALTPAQRQAVAMAYFGGYTENEIARLTGVSRETALAQLVAGVRQLRVGVTGRAESEMGQDESAQ